MPASTEDQPVPLRLRVFVFADWHEPLDELDAFDRSRYDEDNLRLLLRVRAFRRFVSARLEWEDRTGLQIPRNWPTYGHLRTNGAASLAEAPDETGLGV